MWRMENPEGHQGCESAELNAKVPGRLVWREKIAALKPLLRTCNQFKTSILSHQTHFSFFSWFLARKWPVIGLEAGEAGDN